MDADAVLEPKRKRREKEEHREIDDAAAESEEAEEKHIEHGPVILQTSRRPDHDDQADYHFLQRFDAEGVKDYLEQRREWSEKNAVKFSFHDVCCAELIEVEGEDIKEAEGNEREAIEKDDFFHSPVGEGWDLLKKYVDKSEREDRGGHGSGSRDEKVAAIADADFRILREVRAEQRGVAFEVEELFFHFYVP